MLGSLHVSETTKMFPNIAYSKPYTAFLTNMGFCKYPISIPGKHPVATLQIR